MTEVQNSQASGRHYFVDEAGDATLSNRHKKIVVGTQGCSSYFILGLLDLPNPSLLAHELGELRKSVLADPYFEHVPSMQPEARKTAFVFHAKDDVPEVRREVYSLLMRHEMRFFAVVRDKHRIVELVLEQNRRKPGYRYNPNQLYDRCVSRLFKERLHKDNGYTIQFAKRGNRDRTASLQKALEWARYNFRRSWGISSGAPIEVVPTIPRESSGLQAVDYFLWALQRFYERNEERYWEFVWPSVSLVHDIDDTRNHAYGEYYNQRNPLNAAARAKK